jgi:hypothetical protein
MVPETSVSFDHLNAVGHKDGSRNVGFFWPFDWWWTQRWFPKRLFLSTSWCWAQRWFPKHRFLSTIWMMLGTELVPETSVTFDHLAHCLTFKSVIATICRCMWLWQDIAGCVFTISTPKFSLDFKTLNFSDVALSTCGYLIFIVYSTTLYQLLMLHSILTVGMVTSNELRRIWRDAVVGYFNSLYQHLPRGSTVNHTASKDSNRSLLNTNQGR